MTTTAANDLANFLTHLVFASFFMCCGYYVGHLAGTAKAIKTARDAIRKIGAGEVHQ